MREERLLTKHIEEQQRLEVLRNDLRVRNRGSTLSQFAQSEADTPRGRFTAHEQSTVIGVTSLNYPAASAHQFDPCGPEPPLNLDVNALEPTGEPHELRASLNASEPPTVAAPPAAVRAQPNPADAQSPLARVGLGTSSRTYRRY